MQLCPCQIIHIHSRLASLPTDLASSIPSCLHYNLGFIFTASQCSSKSFFQGLQSQRAQPAFGSSLNPCSQILSPHQSRIFCVCKPKTTQTMLPNYVIIRTSSLLGPQLQLFPHASKAVFTKSLRTSYSFMHSISLQDCIWAQRNSHAMAESCAVLTFTVKVIYPLHLFFIQPHSSFQDT